MKAGKLNLFLTAAIAVTLVGCAATKPEPKVEPKVVSKPKKVQPILIKPSGYVKPYGESNAVGTVESPQPVGIFSSSHDGNAPKMVADSDLTTRWSSKSPHGTTSWIILDYGKSIEFNAIRLAFHKGDQRISRFDILVSENGKAWTKVIAGGESSGKTDKFERFPFITLKTQFVKYVGYGNTDNEWNSVSEINAVDCKVNVCLAEELINADINTAPPEAI